ncbi:TackOD1 domain-containing metal-binding protein [Spiribacter insolitus]|uniref:Diguanylate cyclase n=1 Tax=Spiribacter insolitus TaxID=3122417 RepID=A0ABV3T693_9GAMM
MHFSSERPGSNLVVIGDDQLDGLIITGLTGEALLEAARAQRGDPRHAYYPLFALPSGPPPDGTHGAELAMLLDGIVNDEAEAASMAAEHWREVDGQHALPASTPEARLISYLALRPSRPLAPLRDWRSPTVYRFPLLAALGAGESGESLSVLAARGLLVRRELVERLRLCPGCGGAHLLFVDTCPNCARIDIAADESIHCFRCGHVESQGRFMSDGSLQCPNCRARLRHIGTDYDRPLEHYLCRRCGDRFTEPDVVARCSICSHECHPEMLTTREAGTYQLTEYGRMSALDGSAGRVFERFDADRYLNPERFEHLLDWQMGITRAHSDCRFALVLIQLRWPAPAQSAQGRAQARVLVREFAERLPEFLREADICARTREPDFWILMPQADSREAKVILDRLQSAIRDEGTPREAGLSLSARVLRSSDLRGLGKDARSVMDQVLRASEGTANA